MKIKDIIKSPFNFFGNYQPTMQGIVSTDPGNKRDINNRIIRLKLERIKQDIGSWRKAISDSENAFYPNRIELQRLFLDTVLNGHVNAAMQKRKNLSLLKEFAICNPKGVINEDLTKLFNTQWFYDILNYSLDAQYYGYSLINWTEILNNKLKDIHIIKRWNISPDREMVLPFPNSFVGFSIYEPENLDWSMYVTTNSENGINKCGLGLLSKVAYYEIFLRNLHGFNGTYIELFSSPFRQGKTSLGEGRERDEFEAAVRDMGHTGYAITDPNDDIEFKDSGAGGNGYKSYESFQGRLEKTISKLILGHDSGLDSVQGKLGNNNSEKSPAQLALNEIEAVDNRFLENIINDQFIPKLIRLGFNIPADHSFKFLNNREDAAAKDNVNATNQKVVTVVKTLFDAGYKVDAKWITDNTNIPLENIETTEAKETFSKEVQNSLSKLYGKI